ncbi:MAG: hypothetical protein QM793_13755 [Muricomes sp.]
MEQRPPKPMIPFDEMVTSPMIQMIKLFLPYTPASNQRFLGVFAKFLELMDTISFFQRPSYHLHTQAFSGSQASSPMEMLMIVKPYMPPGQADMMESFLNIMNIMEMVQMFQTSAQSEGDGSENMDGMGDMGNPGNMFSGGFNPMDMVMGMLTPDQQNMFQMYNNMFSEDDNSQGNNTASQEGPLWGNSSEPPGENPPKEDRYPSDLNETDLEKLFQMKGDDIDERMDEQSRNEES